MLTLCVCIFLSSSFYCEDIYYSCDAGIFSLPHVLAPLFGTFLFMCYINFLVPVVCPCYDKKQPYPDTMFVLFLSVILGQNPGTLV